MADRAQALNTALKLKTLALELLDAVGELAVTPRLQHVVDMLGKATGHASAGSSELSDATIISPSKGPAR